MAKNTEHQPVPATPDNTLGIILGASAFPKSQFSGLKGFAPSARGFRKYLQDSKGLGIPDDRVLDLFDCDEDVLKQIRQLREWTEKQISDAEGKGSAIKHVILYYVGHGSFNASGEFYLAIRATKKDLSIDTSIRGRQLQEYFKNFENKLLSWIFLDCCFAGALVSGMMSGKTSDLLQSARTTIPGKGSAFLGAASSSAIAIAPERSKYTMFSEGLLHALATGKKSKDQFLSIMDVEEIARSRIRDVFGKEAVEPVLHFPGQPDGPTARVPFVPNPQFIPQSKGGARDDEITKFCQAVRGALNARLSRAQVPDVGEDYARLYAGYGRYYTFWHSDHPLNDGWGPKDAVLYYEIHVSHDRPKALNDFLLKIVWHREGIRDRYGSRLIQRRVDAFKSQVEKLLQGKVEYAGLSVREDGDLEVFKRGRFALEVDDVNAVAAVFEEFITKLERRG